VGHSEQAGEFILVVAEGAQAWSDQLNVVQCPPQKIIQLRLRMLRLHRRLRQLATIGRQQDRVIPLPQSLAPGIDHHLAQPVQLAFPRAGDADLAAEKKVELSGERAFLTPRTLGDGFHQAIRLGEPVHNQAGVRQAGQPDQNGTGHLHTALFAGIRLNAMENLEALRRKLRMHSIPIFLSLATTSALALPAAPQPQFRAQTLDANVGIGYGLAIADVDGDGKPDIVLVDARETVWYKNPTWEKAALTGALTQKDHVCIAAKDIDGDGKADICVGAEWNPGDTKDSGAVFALFPGEDRTKPWHTKKLHHEPVVHRMHWVMEEPAKHFLAVLPLHGCNNVNGEGEGIRFLGYRPESDREKDWETFLIHHGFHLAHNFQPVRWNADDAGESLLVAPKEGVHLLRQEAGDWTATRMTERGCGEVRLGKLPNGERFITTIEPMHGNEVVVNPANSDGFWSEKRVVLDESLNQGHALAAADFLGLGYDQIVAGWREPSKETNVVGLRLYTPTAADGSEWKLHHVIDDNQMACEDVIVADLNGNGKPDIIAAGRSTKNLVIYWNELE